MVTVGMNYKVLPDKGEIFENAFRKVVDAMKEMEGHSTTHLYNDIDDKFNYLIVSDWNSKQAFEDFVASDQFKKVTNWGHTQVLAGRPSHEVYEKSA